MEIRCFCPPESITPRSPTSYRNLAVDAKYRHVRWLTARQLNLLLGGIRATQRDVVRHGAEKRNGVWLTTARRLRQLSSVASSEEYHESEYPPR